MAKNNFKLNLIINPPGFSTKTSVASSSHPEPKPMLMRPVAEHPTRRPPPQHQPYPGIAHVKSEPLLAYHPANRPEAVGSRPRLLDREEYSSSPPVRMRTDPKDLPAPALLPNRMGTLPLSVQPSTGPTSGPGLSRSNSMPRMQVINTNTKTVMSLL